MLALQTDYYRLNYGSSGPNYMSVWAPMFALTYYFGKASAEEAAPVAAAPMDSDGDGVVDADDQCPGTPAGQKVTAYGCAQTEKLEIALNVQFASGKSEIDAKFTADLEKFAAFMNKYPETKAEIAGHTDNTGSEKMNNRISQKRADAVKKYLVDTMKVDQARLTAKGYGPSQPSAENTTPEGRDKNRRVVANGAERPARSQHGVFEAGPERRAMGRALRTRGPGDLRPSGSHRRGGPHQTRLEHR